MNKILKYVACLCVLGVLSGLNGAFAVSPEPGNQMPEVVKQFYRDAQREYAESGLAKMMADLKASKLSSSGAATTMGIQVTSFTFPVLVGKFSNSGADQKRFVGCYQGGSPWNSHSVYQRQTFARE